MTITNGYIDQTAAKRVLGISDTTDDTDIDLSVETASRQLDDHCGRGRKFWQDSTVVARTYYPSESGRVWVDDISTVTGLLVKVDQDDDGTYETSLTINTDFIVEPVNAAAEFPVRPWESIRLLNNTLSTWPCPASGRPPVQVTAKFGWSAVPQAVARACAFQTRNVFKAMQMQNGLIQMTVDGQAIRMPIIDAMARVLMEPFIRHTEVDDRAHA